MVQKLYHLWYTDLRARRRFQIWTILIAFAYGVFNSLVLGRSEKQVTWEALGVVFFLTAIFSTYYCLRTNTSEVTSKVKFTYAHLGEAFRQNRAIFELGLASVTVLLLLFLASRIPDRRVQAAGIDMRLTRAISSPYPFDANSIGEITTIFRWATADRVSISPRLVNVAGKRVVEASRENPSAWPAALAVMDYRSTLIKETSLPKRAVCFDVGNAIGINASVLNSFLGNCTQELDHIAWENVVFENATVVYHGGPAILENVQFKNCQFSVDYTPAGQELAKALTASESVTITLPSR